MESELTLCLGPHEIAVFESGREVIVGHGNLQYLIAKGLIVGSISQICNVNGCCIGKARVVKIDIKNYSGEVTLERLNNL